ncbi:MAG: hypothetical protein HYU30_02440 [Chloroflexi bacterium]|nr:hypothetical protein [Chloroflexota bacterium]
MKTCFYYWLIEPIPHEFEDTSESIPAFEIPIRFGTVTHTLALFVGDGGLPQYARLRLSNIETENIPEAILPMLQSVKEHLISVLRVTFDPQMTLFPYPFWTFIEEGKPNRTGLEITQFAQKVASDPERVKRVFVGSFSHREELRLFVDGLDQRLPLQYRYLSLYKILELEFKTRGHWHDDKLAG